MHDPQILQNVNNYDWASVFFCMKYFSLHQGRLEYESDRMQTTAGISDESTNLAAEIAPRTYIKTASKNRARVVHHQSFGCRR